MVDVNVRKVTFTLDTAGADQDVTIAGFGTVKAAKIEISQGTTLDGNTNHMRAHWGITDFSTTLAFSCQSQNAVLTSNANTRRRDGKFVYLINPASNALDCEGTCIAITDGIRISWDSNPPAPNHAHVTLYGGADLQVSVDELASAGTIGGTASVTGLAFEPDAIEMLSPGLDFPVAGAASADTIIGLGLSTNPAGGIQQRTYLHAENDGQSKSAIGGIVRTDRIMQAVTWSGEVPSLGPSLEVTAYNSDGFTVTQRDSAAFAITGAYLSLNFGGGQFWLGSIDIDTATAGNLAITDPGFEPGALFCIGTAIDFVNIGALQSTDSTGGRWSYGFASADEEMGIRGTVDDAENNTDARSSAHTKLCIIRFFAGGTDYELNWVSFDANGFTINKASASTADKAVIFLAIEANQPVVQTDIEYLRPYEHSVQPNTLLRM